MMDDGCLWLVKSGTSELRAGRLRMSDLVGGGALAHVMYPQHEAKGPGDVYRSGMIELRGPLACARLSSEMANAF